MAAPGPDLGAFGVPLGDVRAETPSDLKLMGKPPNFGGSRSEFTRWAFVVQSYAGALQPKLAQMMTMSLAFADDPAMATLEPGERILAHQLFSIA